MSSLLRLPGYDQQCKLLVHEQGDLFVSKSIREQGIWEPFESQLILDALNEDSCFVDVGANIGYYSVIASYKVGSKGHIFAFEPEPRNFELLSKNIALNNIGNARCVPAGLAAKSGSASIHLSEDNWGDHQIYDAGLNRQSVPIKLYQGDQFFSESFKSISRIDVLKIDTQGAEFQVLSGLSQIIQQSLPNISMVIEFWPFGLKKAGSHAHELLDLLLSYDLPMAIIDHLEHRLIPCVEADIRPWIDDLDNDPSNEGFLNLYLGQNIQQQMQQNIQQEVACE